MCRHVKRQPYIHIFFLYIKMGRGPFHYMFLTRLQFFFVTGWNRKSPSFSFTFLFIWNFAFHSFPAIATNLLQWNAIVLMAAMNNQTFYNVFIFAHLSLGSLMLDLCVHRACVMTLPLVLLLQLCASAYEFSIIVLVKIVWTKWQWQQKYYNYHDLHLEFRFSI